MGEKRQADTQKGGTAKAAKSDVLVNRKRVRTLKDGDISSGPVVYWMSRDQRARDNWALLYAAEQAAARGERVAVVFNLVDQFLGAGARQFGFMLRGLRELAPRLEAANVRFLLLRGDPAEKVPEAVKELGAALLVTDQSPLRLGRQWRDSVADAIECPFHEVDAHNIVPVWETSDKREYAARTIRKKIHTKLPEFLTVFPELPAVEAWPDAAPEIAWDDIIQEALKRGAEVPEVVDIVPGEDAALEALTGSGGFLSKARLKSYADKRNDPNDTSALSGMSPYFHFGQLAPQRAALEAIQHKKVSQASVEAFLEEAVVRRELSDNFCFYEPNYDKISAASDWAKETLKLEHAKTYDDLWNAAQREMVHLGKMHGFMRMYWAKKILEWTESPEQALEYAILLNDKYEIDGRDPNGYVGCMWSVCGIHDQGWAERAVFGKIRYMNYNGCKRKFDIQAYVQSVERRIAQAEKARKK